MHKNKQYKVKQEDIKKIELYLKKIDELRTNKGKK